MENKLYNLFKSEKLVNEEFIIELIDFLNNNNYDIKSINNIVKAICNYNIKIYEKLRLENMEYEFVLKKRKEIRIEEKIENNTVHEYIEETKEDNSMKIDISFYIEFINSIDDYEDIDMILPKKHTDNYQDIINLILLHYFEEYKMSEKLLKDINKDDADYKEYNDYRFKCLKIIEYIKNYSQEINSPNNDTYNKDNKIVFLKTNSDNICVKNDIIKDIPQQFYSDILLLIESIKKGTFKNIKCFNNNKNLEGLYEVKYHDVRLTFKRLSKDVYILIHAFVKKCYTSSQYHNMMESRYAIFKSQKNILLNDISDTKYIDENREILNELEEILVNKKGDDAYEKVKRSDRK